jgi:hypothetical protein
MSTPSPTTAKTEPEALPPLVEAAAPMPASPTDDLAALWNAGPIGQALAMKIAAESGAEFDRRNTERKQ